MDRREFIKNSCTACLTITAIGTVISSCNPTKYIIGKLGNDGLFIDPTAFISTQNGKTIYRSFIIVRNDALQYPVCVYRFNDHEYSALWMSCTHQGTELQVSGDRLQCAAHGSEFDNKGAVKTGPANRSLRNFPVTVSNNQLFIDLRAI